MAQLSILDFLYRIDVDKVDVKKLHRELQLKLLDVIVELVKRGRVCDAAFLSHALDGWPYGNGSLGGLHYHLDKLCRGIDTGIDIMEYIECARLQLTNQNMYLHQCMTEAEG